MRKYSCLICAVLALAFVFGGCAAEKTTRALKIGVISDVGAVPFVIAEQQGFYEKRGLKVEIQVFKSALDRDAALQTGNLDGAMADMLTIVFFNDAGFPVKMTSGTYGNYRLITSPAVNEEAFIKLKSPKVGISSSTVIDFATQKIALAKGFDQHMEKVAIPQMPVRLEMLRAAELDAATLPEPLASAAVQDGGSIIGSTADFGLYPGIFIMTDAVLGEHPESVELLYEAYNEAVLYVNQNDTADYFDFLVERLGFPVNLKGKFVMPQFTQAMAPDALTFKEVSDWMQKTALTKNDYKYEGLTDLSVLPPAPSN